MLERLHSVIRLAIDVDDTGDPANRDAQVAYLIHGSKLDEMLLAYTDDTDFMDAVNSILIRTEGLARDILTCRALGIDYP